MHDELISLRIQELLKDHQVYLFNDQVQIIPLEQITQSLLQRYLREVHRISIMIIPEYHRDPKTKHDWNYYHSEMKIPMKPEKCTPEQLELGCFEIFRDDNGFDTYEEMLEFCLYEGLKELYS